jgi:CubicO group peptidase (beta-lactamase class C family)
MDYSKLMQTRLFRPLHLDDTAVQEAHPIVKGGSAKSGLPVQPWILGAYAPAGGIVSTSRDLARLATALLTGTAPGMSALRPFARTSQDDTQVGIFWHTTTGPSGSAITWHGGETGGYTTYFGLDRVGGRASVVLSDVANPATDALGQYLLGDSH